MRRQEINSIRLQNLEEQAHGRGPRYRLREISAARFFNVLNSSRTS